MMSHASTRNARIGMVVALVVAGVGLGACASDEPGTTKTTKTTTVDGPTERTTTTETREKKVEIDR
jgi:hypothetical protein